MSVSVGKKMRQAAADGYFGKKDLKAAVEDMLDGPGPTKREREIFEKTFQDLSDSRSVRVPANAKAAKREISRHLADDDFSAEKLDAILRKHVDHSRGGSGGEWGGGRSSSGGE
jgi:hypothetical protein